MKTTIHDLVAYLAGDGGDECRRTLADPGSDLSLFLATARERTRRAIDEPAFRGLGLSPAAFLPSDEPPPEPGAADRFRRLLPWIVTALALVAAGVAAWAPWRAAPIVAPPDVRPVAQVEPERPAEKPAGRRTEGPLPVVYEPGPAPRLVPDELPVSRPKAGVTKPLTKLEKPVAPVEPVTPKPPATDPRVIEAMTKWIATAEARAATLERENETLKTTAARTGLLERENESLKAAATALRQEAGQAKAAAAAAEQRSAAYQQVIDKLKPLAAEVAKLREQVKVLEAQLKVKPAPPIDTVKPKGGGEQKGSEKKKP